MSGDPGFTPQAGGLIITAAGFGTLSAAGRGCPMTHGAGASIITAGGIGVPIGAGTGFREPAGDPAGCIGTGAGDISAGLP